MKYPRLPRKYDRRCKLSLSDIQKIKKLRKKGITIKNLSTQFKVSVTTIGYYIYPAMRANMLEKNRKHRWKNPNYNENQKYIRKVNYKKMRKYLTVIQNKRRRTKKIKS